MQEIPESVSAFDSERLDDVESFWDDERPFEDVDWRELGPRLRPDEDLPEMEIVIKNIWDD